MRKLCVRPVAGRLLPKPGTAGEFVGYRRANPRDSEDAHAFRVPGGVAYVALESAEVPNDRYHRQALRRGDLEAAQPAAEPPPKPPKGKRGGEEG